MGTRGGDCVLGVTADGLGYLATGPTNRGSHTEGKSIGEAIDNLGDMARTLLEIMRKGRTPIRAGDQA
jgi:predicted RNase H-like HicB family nuclease